MKWEYKVIYSLKPGYDCDGRYHGETPGEHELNMLGEDGWELVCSQPEWGNDAPSLIFKRPRKD